MFVSTYSTFLNPNSVNKSVKERESSSESKSSILFENALKSTVSKPNILLQNSPVNYLSYNKVFSTKQRINEQLKQNTHEQNIKNITNINSQRNAPIAYAENSKMFSLVPKEQLTLKSTDTVNKNLPEELQRLKESSLRSKMVNTYLENDKYYKITA